MRTVWQSLAWKEWHEHKWKLVAITGVLCGVTGIALLSMLKERSPSLYGFMSALVMAMIPLTLFIAAGESASENSARTMPFLQSLPVPMWKVAAWKLVLGCVTCLLPVLMTLLLISSWYFCVTTWGQSNSTVLYSEANRLLERAGIELSLLAWNILVALFVGITTLSLFVWATAFGVNRKSEVAAGAVALFGIVSCWVGVFVLLSLFDSRFSPDQPGRELIHLVVAATPGGLTMLMGEGAGRWMVLLSMTLPVAIATHAALVAWYLRRFGRSTNAGGYSPQPVAKHSTQRDWLGLPRRSPLTAVVWKQFRESGPVALAGLAAILFFFCLNIFANSEWYFNRQGQMEELLASLILQFGFLVVLIVGIGVFDRDLSPKLNTFWRSRPIDPNLWFWAKYFTGLLVLAVALGAPLLISGTWYVLSKGWWSWLSTDRSPHLLMLVMAISILVAVYALAVAMICLVRVSIYAAILSMSVLAGSVGLVWLFLDSNNSDWTTSNWAAVGLAMASIVALLATLLGWWAVRRDVGWKK